MQIIVQIAFKLQLFPLFLYEVEQEIKYKVESYSHSAVSHIYCFGIFCLLSFYYRINPSRDESSQIIPSCWWEASGKLISMLHLSISCVSK